jgi:NADH-quinone oxidoreductase subunit E
VTDYRDIILTYKDLPGGLIEAYHALQREFNYIPEDAIEVAAGVFDIPKSQAYGVATFYSYFQVGKRGKYIIRMCESAPCHVAGADEILKTLESCLGIKAGETTADGKFTLELTECVGQCQATPVITINSKPYGDLYPEKITSILSECK